MELGFGCEFENGDHEIGTIVSMHENHPFMFSFHWIDRQGNRRSVYDMKKDEIEIIGRPIRLADVVEAMMESPKILPSRAEKIFGYTVITKWNCLKDDLREQSEETLAFLASLLSA